MRLLLDGFTSSVINMVSSVKFKPYGNNKDTREYQKKLGKINP